MHQSAGYADVAAAGGHDSKANPAYEMSAAPNLSSAYMDAAPNSSTGYMDVAPNSSTGYMDVAPKQAGTSSYTDVAPAPQGDFSDDEEV